LDAVGAQAARLLSFIRWRGSDALAVVVPRLWSGMDGNAIDAGIWEDTGLALPQGRWLNVITGETVSIGADRTKVADLMKEIPFLVLRLAPTNVTAH
jgi:(1->4)-alpha-D-glucan 1-alpha-D-glucosylmutase